MGMGVRCVIAPSFGDIFFSNCFQNGLLPVRLPIEVVRRIAEETEASPGNARTTVDLERQVVITPSGEAIPFTVDRRKRDAMLHGLDDIALTLQHADAIAAWKARDRAERGWAWENVA
jgi:3-isopropylmalate/(R)-2-methylmalate dehydratase small subunit